MPLDQRDAAVRTYIDDVFNQHNLGSLDKYWAADLSSPFGVPMRDQVGSPKYLSSDPRLCWLNTSSMYVRTAASR